MKNNQIYIGIGILVIIFLMANTGLFSIVGWGNTLDDYSNEFRFQDVTPGNAITTAYLLVPNNTNSVSFTVDYILRTYSSNSIDAHVFVSYEVYNHNTNSYEIIHDKEWIINNYPSDQNSLRMDGQEVYSNGIPEHIAANSIGSSSYDRVYGCLPNMTLQQAKLLFPWNEGTSSYSYRCIYPDEFIRVWNYRYEDQDDIDYFPKLITLDKSYIDNNLITFKITVNSLSNGADSISYSDFDVELWKINENNTYVAPVCNPADINCNFLIDRSELGVSITKFLTGNISREQLGEIIQIWSIQ